MEKAFGVKPKAFLYGYSFLIDFKRYLLYLFFKLMVVKFLRRAVLIPAGQDIRAKISCKVLLNNIDIANYFPEYRPKSRYLI